MSRPYRTICTLSLALAAVTFQTGCGTIYSDVYSPKRNYFVAPVEKVTTTELPPETTVTTETTTVFPGAPTELPPAPVMPEAAPAPEIPGMEPAPAPAPEAPAMDAAPATPPAMEGAAPAQ